jgi:DNA-binding protein
MSELIKYPVPHEKARFNEIYVKGGRPLPVYLKHAHKVLTKHTSLVIHAMTAAINKAVQLQSQIRRQFPYLAVEVVTDSVPTLVEVDGKKELRERSAIHITLTKL